MSDTENKKALENALSKLLGFEDGEAEDLLEHLLTIESDDDLSEYLVQLLGVQNPEMVMFANDISRYRKGESIVTSADNDNNDSSMEATIVSSDQDTAAALDSFRSMAFKNGTKVSTKNAGQKKIKQNQGTKSRVPPPKHFKNRKSPPTESASTADQTKNSLTKNSSSSPSSHSKSQNAPLSLKQQSREREQQQQNKIVEKSHPPRGKPKIVCGCFGTKNKALANCLYCGRISCEAEGYDFCPFCGFLVEPAIGGNKKAFLHKDRLLRFDREFARRTEVFDDQCDFQAPTTWMTEEEQKEAEHDQQKHLESLKRPKQTLKLVI